VDISLKTTNSDILRFEVYDEGIGMPKGTDPARLKSLGMRLIDSLVRQLGGHIEWRDAKPGTRFILEFPRQGHIADAD
jgi:two-component sensor histidine kinase